MEFPAPDLQATARLFTPLMYPREKRRMLRDSEEIEQDMEVEECVRP